ncbi:MAG TPA: TVP38/TMEM64 family protein [Syntrophomonadaceae bacterium]|nr:TVP38/TMEM64 family protein [Syntrophomonadaceae bacterium]
MDIIQNFSNVAMVSNYLTNSGFLGPATAFFLFVIQAALPVFPYIILASVGGMLFGFKAGVLISWSGALAGASLAYWFFRLSGSEWIAIQLKKRFNYEIQEVNEELAFWSIIMARIVPVIPTPLINVVAALGGVSFRNFFLSSAIGKIPSAVLYTGLGVALFSKQDIKITLIIIGAILALIILGRCLTKGKNTIFSQKND